MASVKIPAARPIPLTGQWGAPAKAWLSPRQAHKASTAASPKKAIPPRIKLTSALITPGVLRPAIARSLRKAQAAPDVSK